MAGIVFIGDSITRGTSYGGVTEAQTFASLIGAARGYATVYNRGVNSDNTAGVIARLERDVFDLQPAEVWMMIGVNDWFSGVPIADYRDNMLSISQAIMGAGIRLTLLSSVLRRGTIQQIAAQEKFAEVAEDTPSDRFIDVFRHFAMRGWTATHTPLYVDPIHLTPAGHAYVADIASREAHA